MDRLAVEVTGLAKAYGDVQAVREVNLKVAHGECVAMLGPNGAGKTTTTEILAGYRERDAGKVHVLGQDPHDASLEWKSKLGIVLQSTSDLKELQVEETVSHFAKYFERPADPDEVITAVGLSEKRKARVGQLSGGQRRRLDVALGIIGNPELLFLDEPTTGFDPEARRQFWDLIQSLKARGTTILLTTHYLEEAERLADRVTIIAAGRVVADETPQSLRATAYSKAQISWLENGQRKEVETSVPTQVLRELTSKFDGEIPELSVVRPSLEEVYLQLVNGNGEH